MFRGHFCNARPRQDQSFGEKMLRRDSDATSLATGESVSRVNSSTWPQNSSNGPHEWWVGSLFRPSGTFPGTSQATIKLLFSTLLCPGMAGAGRSPYNFNNFKVLQAPKRNLWKYTKKLVGEASHIRLLMPICQRAFKKGFLFWSANAKRLVSPMLLHWDSLRVSSWCAVSGGLRPGLFLRPGDKIWSSKKIWSSEELHSKIARAKQVAKWSCQLSFMTNQLYSH